MHGIYRQGTHRQNRCVPCGVWRVVRHGTGRAFQCLARYAFPLSTELGNSEIIRWRESYSGDCVPEVSLTDVKLDVIKDIKFDSIGESYGSNTRQYYGERHGA